MVKHLIGANAGLKRLYKLVINPDPKLAGFLVDENINCKFLPPKEPNFGGLWEAGVKSFKFHFKRKAGKNPPLQICTLRQIKDSRPQEEYHVSTQLYDRTQTIYRSINYMSAIDDEPYNFEPRSND
ncbi:integrase catalytic domain-containing protein [Trichonephila clavipes]|uniref:Integrase catalytic domain-containing protein n=1 Tax=Trichonephila clavipes TaxID=2585209 RepID=A0A8X6W077_TRICX|nr:integrase catalytic domain-containing protein [Trichonephila clavipes]